MKTGPHFYVAVFIVIGLYVEWLFYRSYRFMLELHNKGQNTQADVIRRSSASEDINIVYRFRMPTGEEIESRRIGLPDFLMHLQVGDTVTVRYLTGRPDINYFSENIERRILSAKVMLLVPPFCVLILSAPLLMFG